MTSVGDAGTFIVVGGERVAAAGVPGHLRGADFMPVLPTAAERTNMCDTTLTPKRRLHRPRPEQLQPFVLRD